MNCYFLFSYTLTGDIVNNVVYSFIISSLAGLSTMFGAIFIFFRFKDSDGIILKALAFASGVMIVICITDLIPSSFFGFLDIYKIFPAFLFVSIFIVVGIILSMLINKHLPGGDDSVTSGNNKVLYKVGLISMIAIVLHNIPEGIATFMVSNHDLTLGISLALAISLHNIPEGISISIPIYYSTKSKFKALLYTFVSGLSELFGAVLAYLFLSPYMNDFVMSILFALIAGIMLYIPVYELIPTSLSYGRKKCSVLYFLVGALFMVSCHYLLG